MHAFAILYSDAVMQIKQFITYTVKLTLHCSNLLFTALTYSTYSSNLVFITPTYSSLL